MSRVHVRVTRTRIYGRRGGAVDEVKLNTGNVFVALESLKKKGDKGKLSLSSRKKHGEVSQQEAPLQKEVFRAPALLTTNSWADVVDDDNYFATTAPLHPVWGDGHADESVKDMEDVDDAVRAALQEVCFPSSFST
jgi:hypothetical protein